MPQQISNQVRASHAVPDLPPDLHALDYVAFLLKRKWFVIGCVFFTTAAFLGASYVMPYTYTAQARILPPDRLSSAGLLSSLNASGALRMLKEIENPSVDLIQNLLESRAVTEAIIRDSSMHEFLGRSLSHTELMEKISNYVVVAPKYSQINIFVSIPTPWFSSPREKEDARLFSAKLAALALQATDSLMQAFLGGDAEQHVEVAKADFERKKRDLDSVELAQSNFEATHGIVQLKAQTIAAIEELASIKANEMQAEIREASLSKDMSATAGARNLARSEAAASRDVADRFIMRSELGPAITDLPAINRTYADMLVKHSTLEPIVSYLDREVEQARIDAARHHSLITILDSAVAPDVRSSPKRVPMLMIGVFSGFMISVLVLTLGVMVSSWKYQRGLV